MFEDYDKARAAAQTAANHSGSLVRLRKVREYGRTGYVFRFAPRLELQHGADLEGELIEPEEKAKVPEGGTDTV